MFRSGGRLLKQQEFVSSYVLPSDIGHDLTWKYPQLVDVSPAIRGLRQWLRIHVLAPEDLAMPARSVDVLWHEFILQTKAYDEFCARAYGRKMHHKPAQSMTTAELVRMKSHGLGWTFALACRDEGISLAHPSRLPLLFRVDNDLGIPGGQQWILSCGRSPCDVEDGIGCIQHVVLPDIPSKFPAQGRRHADGRFVPIPADVAVIEPFGVKEGGIWRVDCGG
jgi:hypothetical protein